MSSLVLTRGVRGGAAPHRRRGESAPQKGSSDTQNKGREGSNVTQNKGSDREEQYHIEKKGERE